MNVTEQSRARLAETLSSTEATTAADAARRRASHGRDWPEYYVVDVATVGDLADIVVRFIDEPDREYRIRVELLENGAAKQWTAAGTYLESFLRTREHLAPRTLIEHTNNVLIVDGSEML